MRKLYLNEFREDERVRDLASQLHDLSRHIDAYVQEQDAEGRPFSVESWVDINHTIRACERFSGSRHELDRLFHRCDRDLKDRITGHWNLFTVDDWHFACVLFYHCSLTRAVQRDMMDRLPGGQLILPRALPPEDEIELRHSLNQLISVTLENSPTGGIQKAMNTYGALCTSMDGLHWKVYFHPRDEEKAVLMKCAV
jgi:hypothetical protein